MKTKRVWITVVCLTVCLLMGTVQAAVIGSVEETADSIVISGVLEGGAGKVVSINILKPGADLSALSGAAGDLTPYSSYIGSAVADAQGRYKFTVKKPDYGEYEIVVSAGEGFKEQRTLYLVSDAQMQERISAFNQTAAEGMAARIEADKGLFGLQFEPYETLLSGGKNLSGLYRKLADTQFTSAAQLRRVFRQESLAAALRFAENTAAVEQLMQFYEEEWFYGLNTAYLEYWRDEAYGSRGGKQAAAALWYARKGDAAEFSAAQKQLLEAVAVSALTTSTGFSQADRALLLFAPVYQIDTGVYGGLQEKKELVYKDMMKKDISGATKIKAAFESAIAAVTKGSGGGGSPSGGGGGSGRPGGGSSSGGTDINIYQPPSNTPQPPAGEGTFQDLDGVPWAQREIEALCERGVLQGKEDGRFDPDAAVTREEFVKMLAVAFALPEAAEELTFSDVPQDSWFYPYVARAVQAGIVQGASETAFGAGETISRQDMAVMAARAMEAAAAALPEGNADFADSAQIADYAKAAVGKLAAAGIVHGTDGGNFAPQNSATRAEAAKMIYGLLAAAGK